MSVIVYSMSGCSACVSAIKLLEKEMIDHDVIKIEDSPESWEWLKSAGLRSMPQIVINDKLVEGGYQGLQKWIKENIRE